MGKRKELQISRRLRAAADLAEGGGVLADVGCDHSYLSIYLLQKGKITRALALDVNKGPLLKAKEHIQEWNLENYIETRLSDGLGAVAPGEAQTIVLAGMGGLLMEKILREGREAAQAAQELILQPQSEIGRFRRYLIEHGYCIVKEDMIKEEGKYYPMMRAAAGEEKGWSEAQYRYGKGLLLSKNPVLRELLFKEAQQAEELFARLSSAPSRTGRAECRIRELLEEQRIRKEAFAYYEM